MTENIAVGVGFCGGKSPSACGLMAARAARRQVGRTPPALALVFGGEPGGAAEILKGVREALGHCPVLGCVTDSPGIEGSLEPPGAVQVLLFASPYLKAKIGIGGAAGGDWKTEVTEAFRNSYFSGPGLERSPGSAENELCDWYLYRRPSLVLAVVISRPSESRLRERMVSSFLRQRFYGRVPLLICAYSPEQDPAVFADDKIIREGIVLAMIKTDLQFSLERFHNFEPLGMRIFVTRSEGRKVLEFDGKPALTRYFPAIGEDPGEEPWKEPGRVALHPLAYRGKDGRYHLLMPEEVGRDLSLTLPVEPDPDQPLYPMISISSSEVGLARVGELEKDLLDDRSVGCALILRNTDLRDPPDGLMNLKAAESSRSRVFEFHFGSWLRAYLPREEWEGETSHLSLIFMRDLDPIAMAAFENDRLLGEIIRLKELNQKVFDGIGYGIALLDDRQHIVHLNDTYQTLMGSSTEDLVGRPCPWLGASPHSCPHCVAREAIQKGSFCTQEILRNEEKGPSWLRVDTFPFPDANGKITAAIEVIRDISAFKNLRLSLESERRKMEAVVKGIAESLYIVNREFDLQFFHRGALTLPLGTGSEHTSRKCYEVLFQREFPCPWCRAAETFKAGEVVRQVAQLEGEMHENLYYQVTFSPWRDARGEVVSAICLLVDITAQRKMEQQMIQSEKLNSLSVLSAGMAHELNNPLGAINFNLEVLKKREKNPEYVEVLESIKKDVVRINRIVGSLLSFSRSGANSHGLISLPEVVDAALDLFRVVVERREVEIKKEYHSDLPQLWGNFQDLQQVFINLLSNAVDAMPSGGEIAITAAPAGPEPERGKSHKIAVVYDNKEDVDLLRVLLDNPEWEVQFLRSDREAFDYFQRPLSPPPAILLLDYLAPEQDRIGLLLKMVEEVAASTKVMIIDGMGRELEAMGTDQGGVDEYLSKPLGAERLLQAIRSLLPARKPRLPGQASVKVTFSDGGIGIPPEQQLHIFDPFYTTKSESKGTGLGLSVVHKILESHSATINVKSQPGQGTTFVIRFPGSLAASSGEGSWPDGERGMVWKKALT